MPKSKFSRIARFNIRTRNLWEPETEAPLNYFTNDTRRRRFKVRSVNETSSAPVTTLVANPSADLDNYDGVDDMDNDWIDIEAPVETTMTDDNKWEGLLDKLVLAFKMSCASRKPEAALDPEPSFGCACGDAAVTWSITCFYVTGVITRRISFCSSCYGDEDQAVTLLKRYLLFPATPTAPRTAFHVELLGLFGDARNVLFASLDGFSKIWANRFYNGKAIPSFFGGAHFWYTMMMNAVERSLAVSDNDGCLACDPESLMFCMDGNFSLKRQRKVNRQSAKVDSEFFVDCNSGDDDVSHPDVDDDNSNDGRRCTSLFKAGSNRGISVPYDITGLFGSTCARHGVPECFVDITTIGER
ncbi:hypothetical protein [Absidia glauca]|uniref:Uncharacterized protein n=1 Tax=Absidia glauca TaxID=4829 RepID=A0A163JPJ0_ABSGL|nr:hypothetical protein [Absidia glauca]